MMTSSNVKIFRVTGPLCGEFLPQRPVTRRFDIFFDLRPSKRLNKHSRRLLFETPAHSLWRHWNDTDDMPGTKKSSTSDTWSDSTCEQLGPTTSAGVILTTQPQIQNIQNATDQGFRNTFLAWNARRRYCLFLWSANCVFKLDLYKNIPPITDFAKQKNICTVSHRY